jgi:ATP-binding cassette subfamily B protein/subfamily B ATP-binding cassette protein MsbA
MSVYRRVGRYLRPHRARFVLALSLVALNALLEIGKPWPLKIVVDQVLGGRPLALPLARELDAPALLVAACGGLLVLQAALAILGVYLNRVTIGIGQLMVGDLRAELLTHLQRMSLGFFGQRASQDLVYRVAFDTYAVQSMAMNGVFPLATALVLLVGMTGVMLRMNPLLAGIFLAVAPLLFVTIRTVGRRITSLATEQRENESQFLSETQRGVGAIQVVQAFTAEARERARVMDASARALGSAFRLYVFETGYSGIVNVLIGLGTAGVLYVGGRLALAGRLSAGDIIVFVTYLASLYGPINSISQTMGLIQGSAAGARRVFELLDQEPELKEARNPRPLPRVRGEVRFEDVGFAYGHGDERRGFSLEGVSFNAPAGALVALVGPTGAGKSTLVSLLPRFYDPLRGAVRLDGIDLRELPLRALRATIGIVPQSPLLFPATLEENIRYGRPEATPEELHHAAELAGVLQFLVGLPQGMATPVGPEGQALSQGQMQRVTIARALLKDPRILILDEPTSALDAETEAFVMRGIERAMKGRTTFVIAHRLSTVRRADLLLVLEAGHLVEQGTYESLRRAGGLFQRLHEAQFLLTPERVAEGAS